MVCLWGREVHSSLQRFKKHWGVPERNCDTFKRKGKSGLLIRAGSQPKQPATGQSWAAYLRLPPYFINKVSVMHK